MKESMFTWKERIGRESGNRITLDAIRIKAVSDEFAIIGRKAQEHKATMEDVDKLFELQDVLKSLTEQLNSNIRFWAGAESFGRREDKQ